VLELLAVAPLAPGLVVEVLSPAGPVEPRRLDVAVRRRADPDLLPRRRDPQRFEPLDDGRVVDRPAVLVEVLAAAAAADPRQPGRRRVDRS
jgi:hypothetical protein